MQRARPARVRKWYPEGPRLRAHANQSRLSWDRVCCSPAASLSAISSTFNSLFRVLCTFPARYLFAIGLLLIFSLGWDLPPTLDCTPKQSDSKSAPTSLTAERYGALTLCGAPFQVTCAPQLAQCGASQGHNSEAVSHFGFSLGCSHFTRSYSGNPC